MGRPSNTAERRAQIVSGMLQVMAERGYEGASVVAIAEAAGLASGLVHYHFKTKQAILIALVERLVATVDARYAVRLEAAGDAPCAQIDAWIDAHLGLGADADVDGVAAWVLVGAEAIHQVEVRQVYERAVTQRLQQVTELLRRALAASCRRTNRVAQLAAFVVASIEGAYQLGATVGAALPAGFAAPFVQRAVRSLIDGEPRDPPLAAV